jgi:hypothetical protein
VPHSECVAQIVAAASCPPPHRACLLTAFNSQPPPHTGHLLHCPFMTSRLFWPAPAHSAAQWVFSLRDIRAVFGTRTESRTPLFPTALHNCHRANEAARRRIHSSHMYASIAIIMCHSTHTLQRIPLVALQLRHLCELRYEAGVEKEAKPAVENYACTRSSLGVQHN